MGIEDDIAAIRAKIADHKQKTEVLEGELRGLLRARDYYEAERQKKVAEHDRPNAAKLMQGVLVRSGRKGRQRGAITKRWVDVMRDLYHPAGSFDANDVVGVVKKLENRDMRPSEVTRQFKAYIGAGYISLTPEGRYRVTERTAEKYGFNGPEENEAPSGGPDGASETDDGANGNSPSVFS